METDYFKGIYGNEIIKRQLSAAIANDRVSHCYMLCGASGSGKKTVAKQFAKAIMCTGEEKPCGCCKACLQIEREDNPDVIYIDHEKPTLFSVDEIRDFSRQMNIRPFRSEKKIFILKDAQLLNVQAQNAMLKTIEEPPSYGIIILLTDNRDVFLPTVLSRCVELNLQSVSDDELKKAVMALGIDISRLTDRIIKMSGGNIGMAKRLIEDEDLIEKTDYVTSVLMSIPDMSDMEIWQAAVRIAQEKEDMPLIFSLIRNHFRDISVCKSGMNGFAPDIIRLSQKYEFSDFPRIFDAIVRTEAHRKVNVSSEISISLLLQDMRPKGML